MRPLKDKLTLVMIRATDGFIVRKTRGADGYYKFCYHGKCYPDSRGDYIAGLRHNRLYYLEAQEMHKPHWNKRRCHACQRYLLAEGPPSD